MRYRCVCSLLIVAASLTPAGLAGSAAAAEQPSLAEKVLEMTGARTKIVWQHQVTEAPGDNWDATTPQYELMGFDTAEGKPRVILPGPASYANCCITPDGNQVLFTDMTTNTIYAVNWDGTNKRKLVSGYVLHPWKDPETGVSWFYAGNTLGAEEVYRYRLDDPNVRELVFRRAAHTFTVSADGTHAGSEFPWPNAGVAILPNVSWKQYGNGCNGCIAPDNGYRFMHMGEQAGHQGVMMYDRGGANKRVVWFDNIPGQGRQHCWIPRWTTDVRFLTVTCPIGGDKAEVYLGQFDDKFTKVVRWIRISDQPGQDTKAYCWIDPGLGYHVGEVPLTVELPAPGKGEWRWDYGDGAKAASAAGKHTYKEPGEYRVTARRGETVVKGSVRAYPAKPPSVTAVRFYDESHLALLFDEEVQLKETKVALKSGAPVKGWTLDPEGMALLVELGGAVARKDVLLVRGVYDKAQQPNALGETAFPLVRPRWPSDRTGLVFLWKTVREPSFQYSPDAKAFTDTKVLLKKSARHGRFGELSLEGGLAFAVDAGRGVQALCSKANSFTVEAVVTPANVYQGWREKPRSIIACGEGGHPASGNFRLAQERDKLVFYVRQRSPKNNRATVERVELCTITDQAPNHVVVSYKPGNLACYLNGEEVLTTDKVNGRLQWGRPSFERGLSFGGSSIFEGGLPGWSVHGAPPQYPLWRGRLEGIAIYARAIGPREAATNFAAYDAIIKARPVVDRITVRGRLAAKSKVPNAADIAPYRDALVVYEYEVDKVVKGEYDGKKIRVARWGLIDARPTALSRAKPGDRAELVVEPRADHPELDAQVIRDTLEEDFALPLYVDVANGPTGEPRLASIRIKPLEVWMPPGEKQQYEAVKLDQYRVPIDVPLAWSVVPGGRVTTGAFYGGAVHVEHRKKGSGKIDQNGLFTSDGTVGVVTIVAAGKDDPSARGEARVAVDNYPSIAPWGSPLTIGGLRGGGRPFTGDIDRVRIYNRALTEEEVASNTEGRLTDRGLVADWTFDELKDGTFANTAGKGMTAKVIGEVEHVTDGGDAFIRLTTKWGYIEVPHDQRLAFSHSATLEAWIRPRKPEGALGLDGSIMEKAVGGAPIGFKFRLVGGLGTHAMHGWLETRYDFPEDSWTHVVAVFDVNGVRKHFINGKLVGEHKPHVRTIIR